MTTTTNGEETSMTTMQELVNAEIAAQKQANIDYRQDQIFKQETNCRREYAGFFGEAPDITREKIDGLTRLVASGHGFRFAWTTSRSSGSKEKLHLIRTCPDCGNEYVSDDYLYVISSDEQRAGSMQGAVAKRLAEMHTGYIRKHDCEQRARIVAKAGVRDAAHILNVHPCEIVSRLASDWHVDR